MPSHSKFRRGQNGKVGGGGEMEAGCSGARGASVQLK